MSLSLLFPSIAFIAELECPLSGAMLKIRFPSLAEDNDCGFLEIQIRATKIKVWVAEHNCSFCRFSSPPHCLHLCQSLDMIWEEDVNRGNGWQVLIMEF